MNNAVAWILFITAPYSPAMVVSPADVINNAACIMPVTQPTYTTAAIPISFNIVRSLVAMFLLCCQMAQLSTNVLVDQP